MKNYNEILEILKSKIEKVDDFAFEEYNKEELELGEIKEVDQHDGEGEGDNWYSIKHFVDHDVYFKVRGWYTSHYGTDFTGWDESCSEVKPQQKTITVYES